MKIGSICSRRIVTIDAGATLGQAASTMREHHVGMLVVTETTAQGLHVNGLVTDRDLVIEALARGLDPAGGRIGELASTSIAAVTEDSDLSDAIAAMQQAGVRRLLVTDAEQGLTGILSFDDVVHACARQLTGLADVLRAGLERELVDSPPAPALPKNLMRIPAMGTAGWGPAAHQRG